MNGQEPVQCIYHITPLDDWLAARLTGSYHPESIDQEGFVHCSTREQVLATAERYYAGQTGLVLLEIDTTRLAHPLRFEDSYGHGDRFPHLYGLLNLDAVARVLRFEPDSQTGRFSWPGETVEDGRS